MVTGPFQVSQATTRRMRKIYQGLLHSEAVVDKLCQRQELVKELSF